MTTDPLARGLAIASLVLTLIGLIGGWILWQRSGPALRVSAFANLETSSVYVYVASTGRLPVTVRRIELRDHFVLKVEGGTGNSTTTPVSRWKIDVSPQQGPLPRDLAPTAFLDAHVPITEIVGAAGDASNIVVMAWVERGDNAWTATQTVRIR